MRVRVAVCTLVTGSALLAACASQGIPPGGPPDTTPPTLLRVSPESGSVSVTPGSVEFRFAEVVSERPRAAQSLDQLVLISPSDGPASVSWARDRLIVRARRGWRANTAYSVTILPGLVDLRGNAANRPFRTVFATGATIPTGVLRGVAFDWIAGRAAPGARIEATVAGDTLLKYAAAADSTGRYVLSSLPAQTFLLRSWIDQNNNGVRDTREAWDTVTVALADSARRDLYAFPHDTIGARIAEVTVTDSLTIRVRFDHPLRPERPIALTQVSLRRVSDSVDVGLLRILSAALHDSATFRERAARSDSIARADTSEAGRRALTQAAAARQKQRDDSAAQAQIAAVRASRDTVTKVPPPTLGRPVPPAEFVIVTATPIPEETRLQLSARDVQALVGPPRTSERIVVRPKPPPVDSTAARRRPPPADSVGTRRPPPGARRQQ